MILINNANRNAIAGCAIVIAIVVVMVFIVNDRRRLVEQEFRLELATLCVNRLKSYPTIDADTFDGIKEIVERMEIDPVRVVEPPMRTTRPISVVYVIASGDSDIAIISDRKMTHAYLATAGGIAEVLRNGEVGAFLEKHKIRRVFEFEWASANRKGTEKVPNR